MKKSSITNTSILINQTIFLLVVLFVVIIFPNTEKGIYVISNNEFLLSIERFIINKFSSFGLIDVILILTIGLLIMLINKFAFKPITSKYKPDNSITKLITKFGTLISLYFVLSSSILEEIVFRGIILPGITYYSNPIIGIIFSSILFALVHRDKERIIQLFVFILGILLSSILFLGGSLWACIIIHAANNGIGFFFSKKEDIY